MTKIGKLEEVDPRFAWKDEARHFTPWLAEHLSELGEALGIPIEYEGHEVSVERFSADILARNPMNDARILIENQLAKSDHGHIGQIMTYLAGLQAEVVIWIATEFTEPHLAAIKWLNEHTVEPFAFFAVKLRVVRIGDSAPAPVFEALERPNNWERQIHAAARQQQSRSGLALEREDFWSAFLELHPDFGERGMTINGSSTHWLAPRLARNLYIGTYRAKTGVGVFLRGPRGHTPRDIHERFGPVQKEFLEIVRPERFFSSNDESHPGTSYAIDTTDRKNWPEAIEWLYATANKWLDATDAVFDEDVADTSSDFASRGSAISREAGVSHLG